MDGSIPGPYPEDEDAGHQDCRTAPCFRGVVFGEEWGPAAELGPKGSSDPSGPVARHSGAGCCLGYNKCQSCFNQEVHGVFVCVCVFCFVFCFFFNGVQSAENSARLSLQRTPIVS